VLARDPSSQERKTHRQEDAESASAKRDPFHAQKIGDGKFHADGKHQENHAGFGEHFEGVQIGKLRAGCERADHNPADDESKNQRKLQLPGEQAARDSGKENISQVAKENWIRFHAVAAWFARAAEKCRRQYYRRLFSRR